MNTFTREQIATAFEALPEMTQDILFTPAVEHNVQKVGMDAGLLIDQLKTLNSLVNYVILGLLSEKEFAVECQQTFATTEDATKKLTEAASREIFTPNEELRVKAMLEERKKDEREKELFGEPLTETHSETTIESPLEKTGGPSLGEEPTVGLDNQHLGASNEAPTTQSEESLQPPLSENINSRTAQMGGNGPMAPSLQAPTAPAPTPRIWEREPDIAPDNLPTDEGPESFLPPIPQKPLEATDEVPSWDITPAHPFEEKMRKVFTAGQQSMGDLTIEPATPQIAPPDTSRTYHADPYREPIE